MKYFLQIFFVSLLGLFITASSTFAEESLLTREKVFITFSSFQKDIPESFQYIKLNFKDIPPNSELEDALQKLVYLNQIKNTETYLSPYKNLNVFELKSLEKNIFNIDLESSIEDKNNLATTQDLEILKTLLESRLIHSYDKDSINIDTSSLGEKQSILLDVYKTLTTEHYNKDSLTQDKLVEGAISGLAKSVEDTYTTYFPPIESKDFFQALGGEYEGIGAYVEMPNPGQLIVISPMVGSPAETAGIKGGDIITQVDEHKITDKNSLQEVINWIKGVSGTSVILTVLRDGEKNPLEIKVTRAKIIIKDVEYKKIDASTFYIQIKSFGENVDKDFDTALTALKTDTNVKKVIFDVRNNPGGYLDKVSNMLSYFIPQGESTAIVSTGKEDTTYISRGYTIIDMSKYSKVVLLQNGGSASASEIFVGTMKDYFPNYAIIGEQSFGKGSVQALKNYYDGSTLKYTSAKWFTGKTRQGIDKVGITPDIFLEFDTEGFEKYKTDNQLEKALQY